MKLLLLCNTAPGVVRAHMTGRPQGAVNWLDHVLSDLRKLDISIRILCPGGEKTGVLDAHCSYAVFNEGTPDIYRPHLEEAFRREIRTFQPDIIHSWGVEFGHTLAMVNAAEKEGMLPKMVAGIQGLCGICALHYTEGLPGKTVHGYTFRDFVRRDNIAMQQKKFARRGAMEAAAVAKLTHVIGRTDWDRACTQAMNPRITYHFCNETLREPFYEGRWRYETCRKHRIFASSCAYPVKGFHYLLEAFAQVLKTYPDATLAVPGESFLERSLRRGSYGAYLAGLVKKYGLEGKIEFLGSLSAEEMKENYLRSNVFVMPSTIENSPNSLGEAMLLGVPSAASDVGGVSSVFTHAADGWLYPSTASYMLAYRIEEIFAMEEKAEAFGAAAHAHAAKTHDPQENLKTLLAIYERILGNGL